jgi:hypothetical protein
MVSLIVVEAKMDEVEKMERKKEEEEDQGEDIWAA